MESPQATQSLPAPWLQTFAYKRIYLTVVHHSSANAHDGATPALGQQGTSQLQDVEAGGA